MSHAFTVYVDVPVKVNNKHRHIHKLGKRPQRDFANDIGDIPIWRYNDITKNIESVDNARRWGYAARNHSSYHLTKKAKLEKILMDHN